MAKNPHSLLDTRIALGVAKIFLQDKGYSQAAEVLAGLLADEEGLAELCNNRAVGRPSVAYAFEERVWEIWRATLPPEDGGQNLTRSEAIQSYHDKWRKKKNITKSTIERDYDSKKARELREKYEEALEPVRAGREALSEVFEVDPDSGDWIDAPTTEEELEAAKRLLEKHYMGKLPELNQVSSSSRMA